MADAFFAFCWGGLLAVGFLFSFGFIFVGEAVGEFKVLARMGHGPDHKEDSQRDEGKAQHLALVKPYCLLHGQLPRFLHLLAELHQQAEGKDVQGGCIWLKQL